MRLYLIRHAQSANNVVYDGTDDNPRRVADPSLTELGHKQAKALASHFAQPGQETRQHPVKRDLPNNFDITHLYCSFMTRSIVTANYISNATNIPSVVLPSVFEQKGLYEVGDDREMRGIEGPGRGHFEKHFPNLILPESLGEEGWWKNAIESDEDFVFRVRTTLNTLLNLHGNKDDVVAIVTHWGFMDQFVNELTGTQRNEDNLSNHWRANWVFDNTSFSRFDFINGAKNTIYLNRLDHLPVSLRS